jgi:hypothetical protein
MNEAGNTRPYEIKTEFNIDPDLPHPNVYWLHMDGMVGFDAVEQYFGDPQTGLKGELEDRGFVVNTGARLEAGYTHIAIPILLSPVFYDSYLAGEFVRVARFGHERFQRLHIAMYEKGISLNDIHPKNETLKAFSDVGYVNISNDGHITSSENIDIYNNGYYSSEIQEIRAADIDFNKTNDFKNLIVEASALTTVKTAIDAYFEKKRPIANRQPIPVYQETVDRYVIGDSDSNDRMIGIVRAMKYAVAVKTPHFFYFNNEIVHVRNFEQTIGEVIYDEPVGYTFYLDEEGNFYDEPLEDILDLRLYYPQHKYGVKQMMAEVDIILENDPDAVVIIQADHGIHAYGKGEYDFKAAEKRGYNLQDQFNLRFQVISAVRIPEKYGKLTGLLHPLDIARYLVNHYVGQNYDYLYYKEEE